jgi:hypothetical protein
MPEKSHVFGERLHGGAARLNISLEGRYRSPLFLIVIACAGLVLAAETSLTGIASSFESPAVGRWLASLDSNDAWIQYRVGQLDNDINPVEGVRHLRRATQLCPESRLYWSGLASACESLNDISCADSARERLLQVSPMVPNYHVLVAQAYLRAHRTDAALAQFRRVLQLDPTYAAAIWPALGSVPSPDLVFQGVLAGSPNAEIKVSYANFLCDQGDNEAAYRIWKMTAAGASKFPFSAARPYLERLIDEGRIKQAGNVWQDLERLGVVPRPNPNESENLIFNGDFEQFPLNAGFDWRWGRLNYLSIDFAAPGAYQGARCLRIDFTVGRNQEYEPVYQFVPVLAKHSYRLEAYVRSDEITSDTGPCLRVTDTQQPGFGEALSDTTAGTTPWHLVRTYFSAGPQTQMVRLSVWRPLARVFPTEISGTFWLDAVSLVCVDCEAGLAVRKVQDATEKSEAASRKQEEPKTTY